MDLQLLEKEFHEYAERMAEIKRLSSPKIKTMDKADDYSERLQENFKEIGRLAAINRKMLDEELYPLLESQGELDERVADELEELADMLLTIAGIEEDFENLDLPMSALIRDKLLKDAEKNEDILVKIRRIDAEIDACYSMMNMTERITTNPQISQTYKNRGIELGREMLSYLDKDFFCTIDDPECRERVLSGARFFTAFYERSQGNYQENEDNLIILDRIMDVIKDPYYRKAVPDFDWDYYEFRTLESYIMCTDIANVRGFNTIQLEKITQRADELDALCSKSPDLYKRIQGYGFYKISSARCYYLTGRITKTDYKSVLLEAYENRSKDDFDVEGGYYNVLVPLELICLIDKNNYNAEDADLLKTIYEGLCAYVFPIPNNGAMTFILEYFSAIVSRYIEIPSGVGIEDFVLNCMAAIHPPTYVHSCMVGLLAECLCYHLLKYNPELFVGVQGNDTVDKVMKYKDEILSFAYHAALMHDAGKIFIIDTILVYGRKLLDFEFELIKSHPQMGNDLLRLHGATREYADIALFHHKWYDDSKGYPTNLNSSVSEYKTIIDIVQCADCLDAATDTVGRSYNKGKTVSDFEEELKDGSGTRYAPWLYELFMHEDVHKDIEFILNNRRKRNYRETFNLLKDVQGRNE